MRRPPHRPDESLWANGLGRQTGWVGVLIGVVALAIGFAYHESGQPEWQTMIFTSIAFLQVFQAFGTRSNHESLSTIGWTSNRLMLGLGAFVVGLQLAAIYTPLSDFLNLEVLGFWDLMLCIGAGVMLLVTLEIVKWFRRRAIVAA